METTEGRVKVLGKRALLSHGAIGWLAIEAKIGSAIGSQRAAGWVAHLTVSRRHPDDDRSEVAYGLTVIDPEALEEAAQVLLETAAILREKREGVEKGVWRDFGAEPEECSQYPDSIDWTYVGPNERITCMGHGHGFPPHVLQCVRRTS